MSDGFASRKQKVLIALNSDTPDKSPKGYVDEPLLPLIMLINKHKDYVTTSSCSGRICTYLEGMEESLATDDDGSQVMKDSEHKFQGEGEGEGDEHHSSLQTVEAEKRAKGGQWLYVSHDPVVIPTIGMEHWIVKTLFGSEAHRVTLMEDNCVDSVQDMTHSQLVYFKFEPMILHIEASTPEAAKLFLNHSLFSGYRNSGIVPSSKRTMLAIRSTLKLDVPIAYVSTTNSESSASSSSSTKSICVEPPKSVAEPKIHLMVSLAYLCTLIKLSNDKFQKNVAQIHRFEERLTEYLKDSNECSTKKKTGDQGEWEDKEARRQRKRIEGLRKQQDITKAETEKIEIDVLELGDTEVSLKSEVETVATAFP
ncbi:hypothetical protein BGZ65_003840 [Modicella reniformis]|uniref:tRNA(Phe) 7-[(3-amino-3-carboxypropyl)-4-demethylwyosine(37)-N(4)]-methyltransferase n=1 Tax=Modicella reniformis TaxID=1440133 RepID=A0A9P6M964_9FUNG|nr:hypothetical protein BGZ65_003840 [Modicella reniformis]